MMDAGARAELSSIQRELNSIISELESISSGVRSNFEGIGNEKCADCIDRALNQYYSVRSRLYNMDTSTVTESYARAHGITGGTR